MLQPYVAMNFLEYLRIIRKALWVFFQALGFGCCVSAVVSLFLSFTVGATPVHIASALNWPKAIDLLAAAGASVDAPANYFVMPPLHIAVGHGHADATRALLRAGASIEATMSTGGTALHLAALKDQHAMIEVLAAAGASLETTLPGGVTALHMAACEGHGMTVEALVAAGASLAATSRKPGSATPLGQGQRPLYLAAHGGHEGVVNALVLAGASLEPRTEDGETPLHAAAMRGHTAAVQLLTSAGASLEAQAGWRMYTPLHAAAQEGTVAAIEALVAAGAALEAKQRCGATPLHVAARRGHAKAVEALLAAGSSPEAQTDEGATPLVEAAARGHAEVVSALEAVHSSQTNASCATSAPTEVELPALLPAQLPQTFVEWYGTSNDWPTSPRWWFRESYELSSLGRFHFFALPFVTVLAQDLSLIGSLKASLFAVALSMVAFAVQISYNYDPCIIGIALEEASYTLICAWTPSDEMLAHAMVDPFAVAANLCVPALGFWMMYWSAYWLLRLGNSVTALSINIVRVRLHRSLPTLRRLWAVLPARRLATRPRLRLALHQLALFCIGWCWVLWICSTSPPMPLLIGAGLGVALDVEWWVVEQPSAGICLAAAFFPTHTAVYACVSVSIASLHLIGPLVQAVTWGWQTGEFRANVIWRVFIGLCINAVVDCVPPAALIKRAMKLDAFPGNRPKHWPPPLIIPEALDDLIRDDATPKAFVCPLTMGLMRLPAVTPQGTTYDYEAVASWADARGRYPANESPELLSRPELAPNRVLQGMIEEWVAARSTTS